MGTCRGGPRLRRARPPPPVREAKNPHSTQAMTHRHLFQRAAAADSDRLHFAAHSHHWWLDAALEGHARAAELAVERLDRKWEVVFGELMPRLQERVARRIGWPDPSGIAFAPSTHELLLRLVSGIERGARPLRVLTTDAEFHAARRQFLRWQEAGEAAIEVVAAEPFASFSERMEAAIAAGGHDLVLLSQVFFDSGFVVPDLAALVSVVPDDRTEVLIDGYHSFNALPVDLASVASRAFFTSGGYKYAMSGEGACFLACPPGRVPRPVNTGWFAGFGALETFEDRVGYAEDGSRFLGATLDPTGLFRLDGALGALDEAGLGPAEIHAWVEDLQRQAIEALPPTGALSRERLLPDSGERGHFLCFREPEAGALHAELMERGVWTDWRRDRLRFGFALYHEPADIEALTGHLAAVRAGRGA